MEIRFWFQALLEIVQGHTGTQTSPQLRRPAKAAQGGSQ